MQGSLHISYRGTIILCRELRQSKAGKFFLTLRTVYNPQGEYKDGQFMDVTFFGPTAKFVADRFADGTYQKGDIICIDNANETVSAYNDREGNARPSRALVPIGTRKDRRDEKGDLMFDEKGRQLFDYVGGYEIIFGKNHVYQAEAEPDPEREREAVPPESRPVEVNDDEGLPWD